MRFLGNGWWLRFGARRSGLERPSTRLRDAKMGRLTPWPGFVSEGVGTTSDTFERDRSIDEPLKPADARGIVCEAEERDERNIATTLEPFTHTRGRGSEVGLTSTHETGRHRPRRHF